jgi:hypothetical protein
MVINLWGTNMCPKFHVGRDMGHDYSRYLWYNRYIFLQKDHLLVQYFANGFHINGAKMINA